MADSLLVSQYIDAVIFSILREVAPAEVYSAHEQLAALGVRMLGAVVTGPRPSTIITTPITTTRHRSAANAQRPGGSTDVPLASVTAAVAIVLFSGLAHGLKTDRWGKSTRWGRPSIGSAKFR
ncbi:MAG: hypothetical protein WKF75_19375 [Singulisphaera sp.]